MRQKRNLATNAIATTIGIILAVGLAEALLRIYNPLELRVRGDRIVLPTNREYVYQNPGLPGLDPTIRHTKNSIGFRGPAVPTEGLGHNLSVITVGGSTTECAYLSDGRAWPALLAARLQQERADVWLNNAGLDGHSTVGHAVLLQELVLPLRPDVVLFLVGSNDVGVGREREAGGPLEWRSLAGHSEVAAVLLNIYRFTIAWSQTLHHQKIDLQNARQVRYPESGLAGILDEHRQQFLPRYEARLRRLIQLTREHGAEPVFITQPALYGKGRDDLTGVDLAGLNIAPQSGHTRWAILELYNDVTRSIGAGEGLLVIDLARELPKSSRLFYDYIHFTNAGARQVAEILYRELSPFMGARFPKDRRVVSSAAFLKQREPLNHDMNFSF